MNNDVNNSLKVINAATTRQESNQPSIEISVALT